MLKAEYKLDVHFYHLLIVKCLFRLKLQHLVVCESEAVQFDLFHLELL